MSTLNPSEFDSTVSEADDLFARINNKWIHDNPIPADEQRWEIIQILENKVEDQLKSILDELLLNNELPSGSVEKKICDFYKTAMDTEKINGSGLKPIEPLLDLIEGIADLSRFANVLGQLHRQGVKVLLSPFIGQELRGKKIVAFHIYPGSLGLGHSDYYLKADENSQDFRSWYLSYTTTLFENVGLDLAISKKASQFVLDFETQFAQISLPSEETREISNLNTRLTLAELAHLTPLVDWSEYFKGLGAKVPEYMIIGQMQFLKTLNGLFSSTHIECLKLYLVMHTLASFLPYIDERFEKERFESFGKPIGGISEMKPRWRSAIKATNMVFGEAFGKLYIEHYFNNESKHKVERLVSSLLDSYRRRIKNLNWMSSETRAKALKKLDAMSWKVGYPDTWQDYRALEIKTDSYVENMMRGHTFHLDQAIAMIGKTPDPTRWTEMPQKVNGFYNPVTNEMTFPAAILQPPFFDPEADDAVNLGGIGRVIGHEMTHGFDDQGAQFDMNGNLTNWWSEDDKYRFQEKTDCLVKQFEQYEVLPGLHVNGKYTLGENIADLGGLVIAYDALQQLLDKNPVGLIEGMTPEQRFFISTAITFRGHYRIGVLRAMAKNNPHPPLFSRVNGPLSNFTPFYEAFGCKPGNKLWRNPEDRIEIW